MGYIIVINKNYRGFMNTLKYIVLLILFAVVFIGCGSSGGGSGNASSKDEDGTLPMDAGEETLILNKNVYIVFGDGITSGSGLSGRTWAERLRVKNVDIINLAVSGTHSEYGANNIEGFMHEYKPHLVMVLYGVNDVSAGIPTATIIDNLESIIQVVQYYGGNIILGTIPVVSLYSSSEANSARRLNTDIKTLCNNYGIPCADAGSRVGYSSRWYLEDGLHPTLEAHKLIQEVFKSKIGR